MSLVGSNALAGASGQAAGGGGYEIARSLRFNPGDSAYLNRTPSSAGNRKTWTWSGWLKRSGLGVLNQLFVTQSGGSAYTALYIDSSNKLRFEDYESSAQSQLITTQVFRDVSAWQHIVVAVDTTQATASNRVKLYVNGQQVTQFDTETYMSQNRETYISNTVDTRIGGGQAANQFVNGYLADVQFLDAIAASPTDFGETDDNGVWQPKKYEGNYNGAATSGTGTTITPTASAGFSSSNPAANAIDGDVTTAAQGNVVEDGYFEFTFSPPLAFSSSVEVNCYAPNGYGIVNYSDIDVGSGYEGQQSFTGGGSNFNGNAWITVKSGSGSVSKIKIRNVRSGSATATTVYAIRVDSGSNLTSTGTPGTPAGVNGFHLDFSDNSSDAALGTDSSGNSNTWTVNNLTASAGDITPGQNF